MTVTAQIETVGRMGQIPVLSVPYSKPRLRNNGYNCYSGQGRLHVPQLRDLLPDDGFTLRQGHVLLRYSDGKELLTFTSTIRGDDTYDFS